MNQGLVFLPLGGCGEIGLNVNLYGVDDCWIMVDLGISFPDESFPGAEIVLPEIGFAESLGDKLKAIIVTHAHEDHCGAIPHLWQRLNVPIHCAPFTASIIRSKLKEVKLAGRATIHSHAAGVPFDIGPFTAEFIGVSHSVPDARSLALRTPHGTIIHSGDWKIDPNPLVGNRTDQSAFTKWGDEGVLALVADSTNILSDVRSGSELEVRESLSKIIAEQDQRVVVTSFASNIARLTTAIEAARANDREVAVVGRSMHRMLDAAKENGMLPESLRLLSERDIRDLPRRHQMLLTTGCQGEARAALSRIATGTHPSVELDPGDTVIFSSKIIPGNERTLYGLHNRLVGAGIKVITEEDAFVHVSGHPGRQEVAELYEWVRPRYVIPVHGEPRHLHAHVQFAREHGAKEAFRMADGDVLRLAPGEPEIIDDVTVGRHLIDGHVHVSASDEMFRSRRRIGFNGVVLVSLVLDEAGSLLIDPKISTIGLLETGRAEDLSEEATDKLSRAIELLEDWEAADDERIQEIARSVLRKTFGYGRDKRPLVEIQISRLTQESLSELEPAEVD